MSVTESSVPNAERSSSTMRPFSTNRPSTFVSRLALGKRVLGAFNTTLHPACAESVRCRCPSYRHRPRQRFSIPSWDEGKCHATHMGCFPPDTNLVEHPRKSHPSFGLMKTPNTRKSWPTEDETGLGSQSIVARAWSEPRNQRELNEEPAQWLVWRGSTSTTTPILNLDQTGPWPSCASTKVMSWVATESAHGRVTEVNANSGAFWTLPC